VQIRCVAASSGGGSSSWCEANAPRQLPNAEVVCDDSAQSYTIACHSGYVDANGDSTDGCESAAPREICGNGIDDDGDLMTDESCPRPDSAEPNDTPGTAATLYAPSSGSLGRSVAATIHEPSDIDYWRVEVSDADGDGRAACDVALNDVANPTTSRWTCRFSASVTNGATFDIVVNGNIEVRGVVSYDYSMSFEYPYVPPFPGTAAPEIYLRVSAPSAVAYDLSLR